MLQQLSVFGRLAWWVGMATDVNFHHFGSLWHWECAFFHRENAIVTWGNAFLHRKMQFLYDFGTHFGPRREPWGTRRDPWEQPWRTGFTREALGGLWETVLEPSGSKDVHFIMENAVLEKWCQTKTRKFAPMKKPETDALVEAPGLFRVFHA